MGSNPIRIGAEVDVSQLGKLDSAVKSVTGTIASAAEQFVRTGATAKEAAEATIAATAAFSSANPAVMELANRVLDLQDQYKAIKANIQATAEVITDAGGRMGVQTSIIERWTDENAAAEVVQRSLTAAVKEYQSALSQSLVKTSGAAGAQADAAIFAEAEARKQAAINATNAALMEESAAGEGMVGAEVAQSTAVAETEEKKQAAINATNVALMEEAAAGEGMVSAEVEQTAAASAAATVQRDAAAAAERSAAALVQSEINKQAAIGATIDALMEEAAASEGMVGAEVAEAAASIEIKTGAEAVASALSESNKAFLSQSSAVQNATKTFLDLQSQLTIAKASLAETRTEVGSIGTAAAESSGLLADYSAQLTSVAMLTKQAATAEKEMKAVIDDVVVTQQQAAATAQAQADALAAAEQTKQAAINATNEALMEEAAMSEGMVSGDEELTASRVEEAAAAQAEADAAAALQKAKLAELQATNAAKEATAKGIPVYVQLATVMKEAGLSAQDISKTLKAQGFSAEEASAALDRLGMSLKEVAVAEEEAAGVTGYAVGRFGAMELGLGQLGFVFGRVAAAAKGLNLVFEALLPILAVGIAVDIYENAAKAVEKWRTAEENAAAAARDLQLSSEEFTDRLRLENAELESATAKLNGTPGNGLQLAFEQIRVESDRLTKSLDDNLHKIDEIFSKNPVGLLQELIMGTAPDTDISAGIKPYIDQIITAVTAQHNAVEAVKASGKGLDEQLDAEKSHEKAVTDAYAAGQKYVQDELDKTTKKQSDQATAAKKYAEETKDLAGFGVEAAPLADAATFEDQTRRITDLKSALATLASQSTDAGVAYQGFLDHISSDKARAAHDAAEESTRALAAERKATSEVMKVFDERLTVKKAQENIDKAHEAEYWEDLAAETVGGTALNFAIQKKAAESEIAIDKEIDAARKVTGDQLIGNEKKITGAFIVEGTAQVAARKALDENLSRQFEEDIRHQMELYKLDEENAVHDIEMKKKLADVKFGGEKAAITDNVGLASKDQIRAKTEEISLAEHNATIKELTDLQAVYAEEARKISLIEGENDAWRKAEQAAHEAGDKIAIEQAQYAQKVNEEWRKALQGIEQQFNSVGTKIETGFIHVIDKMMTDAHTKFGREMAQLWNQLLVEAANYYAKALMADAAHWAKRQIMAKVGTQALITIEQGLATILQKIGLQQLADDLANLAKKQAQQTVSATTQQAQQAAAGVAQIAQQKAIDSAIAAAEAGVSFAAAFASVMAALPFPANVAAAPGIAAAAAAATIAGGVAFEQGGVVPSDNTLSILHAQEMVLPKNISVGLQSMIAGNSSSSSSSVTNAPTTINQENHFHNQHDLNPAMAAKLFKQAVRRGQIGRRSA